MNTTILHLFCTLIIGADAMANSSSLLDSKILGGHNSNKNTKKFMASLRIREKHICCGFLISRRIVMSTGSCVNYIKSYGGTRFNYSSVFVGSVNLNERRRPQIASIDHVDHYPGYNPADPVKTCGYDVGYVLLADILFVSNSITTVTLARNFTGTLTTQISGWGSVRIEPTVTTNCRILTSRILKEIKVNITDAEICAKALNRKLRKIEMCGIGYNEGETATKGDIGSPLLRFRTNIVVGFTSIVNIIADKYPIVFIRAPYFYDYSQVLLKTFPDQMIPNDNRRRLRDPNYKYEDLPNPNLPEDLAL